MSEIISNENSVKNNSSIIVIENAFIHYGDNIVLDNISFKVDKGEFVYFLGRTGSGKSSIMKMLYADFPFNGDVGYVLDYDLKKIKQKDIPFLRRRMGMVFQDFQLLIDRNVFDNLLFVLQATGWKDKEAISARIESVLNIVGMYDKKDKMPHQLSGGEQQKIVIARALLNEPDLILADEPTGNLDPQSSEEILNTLQELKKNGKTVIVATHDMPMVEKFPSRTLWFADGNVTDNSNLEAVDNNLE